jgi:GTPase SAR1 family protein/AraC-like DNA-binding protein
MAFELRRRQELNVLLIGETGVGKSTLINSFANYIKFRTLDEAAEQCPPLCLISTHFKEKKKKVDVEGSSHMPEGTAATKAGTQIPATYLFQNGFWYLRFIDTPGICDTRGEKQDKENFKCLSTHLSKYFREIHGICILVKSNQQKLTPQFESMINLLLNYFSKDAIKNIVFCFTSTRYCNYADCQAEDALSDMFKEKHIDITMSKQNSYYIDSEAFKYLCAKSVDVQYTDMEVDFCRKSWENSEKELCRMLYYFEKLDPHKTEVTASLHDAQNLLSRLTRPIGYVVVNIQENILELEKYQEQLKKNSGGLEEVRTEIVIENVVIKPEKFPSPRLVCKSAECQKHEKAEDFCVIVKSIEFRKFAYNFWFLGTSCDKCKCFYWDHTVDTYKMKKEVVKTKIRSFAETLKREQGEMKSILFALANVTKIVKENSFSAPIDQFDSFTENLVAEEKKKT